MSLRLMSLVVATASVAMCLALPSGGGATATDRVTLIVDTKAIDGAVLFTDGTPWSWRCVNSGPRHCTVETERGRTMTLTAEKGTQSSFWSWDGICASSGSTCSFQINDTVSLTATFSARLYLTTFGPGTITREKYPSGTLYRRTCSGWTRSDFCGEYAYGEKILLSAQPSSSSAPMTGWGGTCSNVSSKSDCIVAMTGTTVDSATFAVPPPPPPACAPNTSCDPLTLTWRFYVQIWGAGKVLATKVPSVDARGCSAPSSAGFYCSNFEGSRKGVTELKALPIYGGSFLGWSGPCSGTGSCRFRATSTPVKVYARFG
jgi:hypothetical protein